MNRRNQRHRGYVVQSNCGDVKLRGTVDQVIDKYRQLAEENEFNRELYLQHADHYVRVQKEMRASYV